VSADLPTNSIDLASPNALITILFLASLAYSTTNLALSASYYATCLASTASKYSFPNVNSVIETSSIAILN
jgi:hypothetical protein